MIRGTLRHAGFCRAWNVFVQLGLTDDSFIIENSEKLTYRQFVESFIPSQFTGSTIERLCKFMNVPSGKSEISLVEWTGILEEDKIDLKNATPAKALQNLLENKWKLTDSDKDMVVMQHQFEYSLKNKKYLVESSLVVKGANSIDTAMAKTVGLPVAIAAKNILLGKIKLKGVQIPVDNSVYEPVMEELKKSGISFNEVQKELA